LTKKKQAGIKDPHAKREEKKYKNPIPSREYILKILEKKNKPMAFEEIFASLKLSTDDQEEALGRRLKAMCRDGQILQNRRQKFALIDRLNLIRGTVQGHRDGYGFLIPDDGSRDLFIPVGEMRQVFDGDKALVRELERDQKGRRIAIIVEVLERANEQIVGRYFRESGIGFVQPGNQRITQDILIPEKNRKKATSGQMVLLEIMEPPGKRTQAKGKVVKVLGDFMSPGMETEVAIHAHNIPYHWPADVNKEAAKLPADLQKKDYKKREDLRHLPFVTIDGCDAKDFDDAVYCEPRQSGGFRLFVAIADVSHYIKPKSALDKEALNRGNSVYFPNLVVPMLPEQLSNGLCSLLPKVDRLVMVCEMNITNQGKMTQYQFYPGVIHSHARLTYDIAADIVQHRLQTARDEYQDLLEPLDCLYQLYHALHAYRTEQGTLHFEVPEPIFIFDEAQKIKSVTSAQRNDAHKVIEECMLSANVAAANFILKAKFPGLFRVHPGPNLEKVAALVDFLKELGLRLENAKDPTTKDYNHLIESIQTRDDARIIQMIMLRSLQQAYYSGENAGHFGLGFEAYTHFTSPIRRYPDLIVHRTIKNILETKKIDKNALAFFEKVAQHCSQTERKADEATREVMAFLQCEYMQNKLGEEFDGIINSVTAFGLFVELKDNYIEGLVHITSLPDDYYRHDEAHHRLVGERTRACYGIGESLRVLVARVSLDERKIDFEPVIQKKKKKRKR